MIEKLVKVILPEARVKQLEDKVSELIEITNKQQKQIEEHNERLNIQSATIELQEDLNDKIYNIIAGMDKKLEELEPKIYG